MRHFLIISNTVDTTKALSLNSLTGYGRLDVICRCITAAFFLSNEFRKDVTLEVFFRKNKRTLEISPDVRGINPDERAIAGVLKRVFIGYSLQGIRFFHENLETLLERRKPVILDSCGNQSIQNIEKYNAYLIGDQIGFLEEDRSLIENLPKLTLGSRVYLSSQAITILNYNLDLKNSKFEI
jgi:tRNA (pseudouridine54-N1)-methyltransferase